MNNYIKQLIEAFDFNSVKKQNKKVNVVDTVLKYIIPKIDNREKLSQDDYDLLKNLVGIYKVSEKNELKDLIDYFIEQFGNECNLNWIDVSNVTNMGDMFYASKFDGDISQWDVSNVTDMPSMFMFSKFNGNISQWNVSNVINMGSMFYKSVFDGDISKWDVSNVINMCGMFTHSAFNGDISQWDVSNVADMETMFTHSAFKQDISNWKINHNCNIKEIFSSCPIPIKYQPKLH